MPNNAMSDLLIGKSTMHQLMGHMLMGGDPKFGQLRGSKIMEKMKLVRYGI